MERETKLNFRDAVSNPCHDFVFGKIQKQFKGKKDKNMINALLSRGERMQSIHDRDCEWLRKKAYKEICIENADFTKVDKIVNGIKDFKINKSNLFDEVRKFTKRVTSCHSINRWQIITEWFEKVDWH